MIIGGVYSFNNGLDILDDQFSRQKQDVNVL
jgi:hypothetical protein